MVWGCFPGFGLDPLVPMKDNVNATAYEDIKDNYLLPTVWQQFGEEPFLFRCDCALVQKASFMKTRLDEFVVKELQWPALSPDLTPTEQF